MAFTQEGNVTKDSIGDFEIVFFVPAAGSPEPQAGRLRVQIVLSDGTLLHRSYNLLARLQDDAAGVTHLSNLASLRDYIRTRLENEVIP